MKSIIIASSAIAILCSCASAQQNSSTDGNEKSFGASLAEKINASVSSINNSVSSSIKKRDDKNMGANDAVGDHKHLRNSDLKDIIGNSSSDKWPRIAVTINSLPNWFYSMPPSGMQGRYSPRDCINISITAWHDQKHSKSYDNMDFCGDDIVHETPFSDVGLIWKNFGIVRNSANTGAQRTNGPLPPMRLFPNKPGLDMFFQLNGSFYVGSIMATLGYNWKEPQDARFWIVNVPTQAETVHR